MANNSDTDTKSTFKLYHYEPSLAAAIVFTTIFFLLSTYHTFRVLTTRTWFFIPFCIGGFLESIGYVGRAIGSQEPRDHWSIGPYIMQSIAILVAPALFAASIYMMLGKVMQITGGGQLSLVREKWITRIFVAGDVFSFLMQSAGGGTMAGGSNTSMTTGEHIIIGGLALQIIFFSFFVVVALTFHIRTLRPPPSKLLHSDNSSPNFPHMWQKYLYALYTGSALILVRSVFRLIEYAQGNNGYLISHEWFLYVFDAVLMVGVMVLFAVVHPTEVGDLARREKEMSRGEEDHVLSEVRK